MKHIKDILFILAISLLLAGCGTDTAKDEPANPSGLYDWDITKNVINRETGDFQNQFHEILYDKSESYVIDQKTRFENQSTKYFRYQYIYKRL